MDAKKPASSPTPASSVRCTWRSRLLPAPTARMMANSRARSSRVAVTAANSTTKPAASVKPNRNSTARMTWSSTRCTWLMVLVMSTLVILGNSRTKALSNPLVSGALKAPIYVLGTSLSTPTGYITKKLARMEPQSTLRSEVIFDSVCTPPMSKRRLSPSFRFSVLAMPSSTLTAPSSSSVQRPAITSLCGGFLLLCERLNSRSTKRLARSSV